jgi:hypothetical protein
MAAMGDPDRNGRGPTKTLENYGINYCTPSVRTPQSFRRLFVM